MRIPISFVRRTTAWAMIPYKPTHESSRPNSPKKLTSCATNLSCFSASSVCSRSVVKFRMGSLSLTSVIAARTGPDKVQGIPQWCATQRRLRRPQRSCTCRMGRKTDRSGLLFRAIVFRVANHPDNFKVILIGIVFKGHAPSDRVLIGEKSLRERLINYSHPGRRRSVLKSNLTTHQERHTKRFGKPRPNEHVGHVHILALGWSVSANSKCAVPAGSRHRAVTCDGRGLNIWQRAQPVIKLTVNAAQLIGLVTSQTRVDTREQNVVAIETEVLLLKFD